MASPARRSGWTFSVERRRPRFGDFAGLALITLIALKLAGVIAWSWWWVLVPLWVQVPGVIVVGLLFVYAGVAKLAEWSHEWRQGRRLDRLSD